MLIAYYEIELNLQIQSDEDFIVARNLSFQIVNSDLRENLREVYTMRVTSIDSER